MGKGHAMSLEIMLSRLNKVRKSSNNSWMATCPAHADNSPSLSIKDVGDDKLLLNCLAGCATEDILGALGMEWADIMPPNQPKEHYVKPTKQRVYATDALRAIRHETQIVCLAAYDLCKGIKPNETNMKRLELAMERINTATEMANV
jgi:hypothetical protein